QAAEVKIRHVYIERAQHRVRERVVALEATAQPTAPRWDATAGIQLERLRRTPGPPRGPGPSPLGEFLEGRLRHACVPGRVAQFQPIATRIEKIEFPPGEAPLLAMIQVLDPDLPLPKQLARPDEGLRTDGERVMHLRILDKGVINRRRTLAEQDMVPTGGE